MHDLQHLSLSQIRQLLNDDSEQLTNNYITKNLAVVRQVPADIMKMQSAEGPLILPEMRIFIVREGWVEPELNLTPHRLEAGELVFVGPDGIIQVGNMSPDASGFALSMNNELFGLAIGSTIPKAFDGHLRDFYLHLEPDELDFLDRLHQLLYQNIHRNDNSRQTTLHLIRAFLWTVDHLWSRHEQENRASQSRDQRLFSDFMQLVNIHASREHSVDFYASRLFVSPRYFSGLIKKISGRTAKEWIDETLATNIKIELRYTGKQIRQISEEMNFSNVPFFCKFFKRMTGQSPHEYRTSR